MNIWSIRAAHVWITAITAVTLFAMIVIGFSLLYNNKIYPGVAVDGLYMGGSSRAAAEQELAQQAGDYSTQQIPLIYARTTLQVPVKALNVNYDSGTVISALDYGRSGNLFVRLHARLRALAGRPTVITAYHYDAATLTPFLDQIDDDITLPVANAQLTFADGHVGVIGSRPGRRIDRGLLVKAIDDRVATMNDEAVTADISLVEPTIKEGDLSSARHQAADYVSTPLTATGGGFSQTIDQPTILSWLDISTPGGRTDMPASPLQSFYPEPSGPIVTLSLNQSKLGAFVATVATNVNRDAQNAVVSMQNGKLSILQASQPGTKLDETKAAQQITAALKRVGNDRSVVLSVASKPADVNENNLDSLGIKDQLSEGQTFFPGSSANRLINVRVGAAKYNGVLLKPGETFSFGQILGDVGPAQGYVPELVILGDHEEKQYGGGLCQVASTAYRAALLAGLPIVERHNHSFAVSFYTAPYGVPGVDATIYYPQVDFKFKNDTGHYMLIQTEMQGTTLTFDYYGTKTKYGEIRGPQFISGSTDATQASHTIFWRDIKNLDGSLAKTDAIETYYEPSTNFPVQKQFN